MTIKNVKFTALQGRKIGSVDNDIRHLEGPSGEFTIFVANRQRIIRIYVRNIGRGDVRIRL